MSATLQVDLGLPGITPLTCTLYPEDSETAAASDVVLTEATNRLGMYVADDVALTGQHKVVLFVDGEYFPATLWADIPENGVVTCTSSPASKSGYKLAADGLDTIAVTPPERVAVTFREMLVQLWRRAFKRTYYDIPGHTIKTFADDGTTEMTTQTVTATPTTEDVGAAE